MSVVNYPDGPRIAVRISSLKASRPDGARQRRTRSGDPKHLWNMSRDKLARSAGPGISLSSVRVTVNLVAILLRPSR